MEKIKFVSNYDNDYNIYKSILNCFPLSEKEKKSLTFGDDYRYLGIFNGYRGKINTTRDNIFGFLQEPRESLNYDKNLHFYCSKIYCQNKNMFSSTNGIIEVPLQMFFTNHTEYHYSNFLNDSFEKEKKMCIFVSSISHPSNPEWQNHNYGKRVELIKKILNSNLDIDIYGRGLNLSDSRYKGSPHNKHEILKKYQYSIAIENTCQENYVSEKFFDCILNNVVPLYYGCPNVDEIFNNGCYSKINLDSNKIIEEIDLLSKKNTLIYHKFILDAKQSYFLNFNPLNKIKSII